MTNICRNCIHCTHEIEDELLRTFFYCEIDRDYISDTFALDETIGCDAFVEKLDDNETA